MKQPIPPFVRLRDRGEGHALESRIRFRLYILFIDDLEEQEKVKRRGFFCRPNRMPGRL